MRKPILTIFVAGVASMALSWAGCASRGPVEGEKVLNHTIERGETLEQIAEDYYGDAGRADDIARFNEISGGALAPGTVIRVSMTPDEMKELHYRKQARAPYNDGLELASRGSYLEAAERFQQAVAFDRGFADAWFNLALTHQRMGVLDKAVDEYRKAVKLRPDNVDYRYALGGAFFYVERYRDAIATFEKALKKNPKHRKSQYSLALAFEKTGDTGRARAAWERYLELDSASEWADEARRHVEALR